jgi:hypothetical protein
MIQPAEAVGMCQSRPQHVTQALSSTARRKPRKQQQQLLLSVHLQHLLLGAGFGLCHLLQLLHAPFLELLVLLLPLRPTSASELTAAAARAAAAVKAAVVTAAVATAAATVVLTTAATAMLLVTAVTAATVGQM